MGLVFTTTAGLIVWIVMWALGTKAIDAFLITVTIVIIGLAGRILLPFLPGRQD